MIHYCHYREPPVGRVDPQESLDALQFGHDRLKQLSLEADYM